jgi:chemotaxis protein MotB
MRGKVNGRFGPGRAPEPEEDDSTRWLGTYADAVTLLMAFFVMLYAMSETDAVKFTAFLSGLEGPFGNTSVELLQGGGGIVGPGGANAETANDVNLDRGDPLPAVLDMQQAESDDQLQGVEGALDDALQQIGLAAVADYRVEDRGLVVSVASDDVLFALGSTEVSPIGRGIIGAMAGVLDTFPNLVLIEGHTDDLQIAREDYSNWNLSTDRAIAVLDVLVDDFGMDPFRLGASGFGEFRPVVENDSPLNRARNRRVDVLIIREGMEDG